MRQLRTTASFNVYGGSLKALEEQAKLRLEALAPGREVTYTLEAFPVAYTGGGDVQHWEARVEAEVQSMTKGAEDGPQ